MRLEIDFSDKEIKQFLKNEGYKLTEHKYDYWDQWGNHDSQGDWKERTVLCAIKENQEPSIELAYKQVFNNLISKNIKQFLLK